MSVTEIKLGKVAMQVLLAAMLIGAFHPAFEDRKEAFNRVRVNVAAHILVCAVADKIMACEISVDAAIVISLIGDHAGFLGDVFAQDRFDGEGFKIVNNDGASAARGAVNKAQDFHLVRPAASARLLRAGRVFANKGFVGFNDAAIAAHRGHDALAHRFADAVPHEPSGFVGDTDGAVQLMGGHALL